MCNIIQGMGEKGGIGDLGMLNQGQLLKNCALRGAFSREIQ